MQLSQRSTDRLRTVFKLALGRAIVQRHTTIYPGHVLLGLVDEGKGVGYRALINLKVAKGELENRTHAMLADIPHSPTRPLDLTTHFAEARFNEETLILMNAAERVSTSMNYNYIGTDHLCVAFFDVTSTKFVLEDFGITRERVYDEVVRILGC